MPNKKIKILMVAMADSVHTARWTSQFNDLGWEVHLYPAVDWGVTHPSLENVTVHHSFYCPQGNPGSNLKIKGRNLYSFSLSRAAIYFYKTRRPRYRVNQLARLIKKLKPDIVHSLEFSLAGYLTLEVKKILKDEFPKWIATNWGSDIYLFGQLKIHEKRIKEVLANCDFYSCECARDVVLARNFGFKGKVLPVFPNTGGFDLKEIQKFRTKGKTSKRKTIILKGYQNWSGRALVGLRALERCADVLKGYKIVIFSTFPGSDVEVASEILTKKTGIQTKVVYETAHRNILKLQGQARIYIGLNISDAISTSLLEAIVMGAFPIQSNTSCACEWIKDGKTGILVPPEDPEIVEMAIRQALGSDKLVDEAARLNFNVAKKRLQKEDLKKEVINFYRLVLGDLKGKN
ncbi:MAG: glycosyltransferase [Patescibacteria group bacterium]|nr:glycosyltransferase [Patescibacteria group bacterium]